MTIMRKTYITIIMALLLLPMTMGAQALKGSYFLDNSLTRTKLNPAFAPRANYFSLPVVSNVGVGFYGNMGPADFLYPIDGNLYSYLNKMVSVEEFSKNLAARPGADFEFDTDILGFGFYTSEKSFWNFELGLKLDASFGIPRDLFMLTKQGMPNPEQVYSLSDFNLYQTSSVYAAIGHSRDLSNLVNGLRIGAKVKFYAPLNHVGMSLGDSYLSMSEDKWAVKTNASAVVATSFLKLHPEAFDNPDVNLLDLNFSNIAPAGYGVAFDLGAEYRISTGGALDGMTFSVSAIDLGSFFFSEAQVFTSKGEAAYQGFKDLEFGEQFDMTENVSALMDEFLGLANLEEESVTSSYNLRTCPKIYAGVEYPFLKDKMSVGLLYSGKLGYSRMINELTLSYNLNPARWFNFGVNWSFLNTYKTVGWIMEFTPKGGLNLFIGSDYTFWEVMPTYYLPVDKFWFDARFGLSFALGTKHRP